jgi:hypothetical protein
MYARISLPTVKISGTIGWPLTRCVMSPTLGIRNLAEFIGVSVKRAEELLAQVGGDVERAAELHWEGGEEEEGGDDQGQEGEVIIVDTPERASSPASPGAMSPAARLMVRGVLGPAMSRVGPLPAHLGPSMPL